MIANEGFHWRSFLFGGSLPFSSGVVVSLRPLSACLGSLWLVTAPFPSLSLYLPVPIFSWLHLLLRRVPWVCCLTLPMVVRTLKVGPGVSYASCLPFTLHRALGLLVPVASFLHWGSLPLDGVTPAGSRIVCPRSEEGLVSPFGSGTLVSSWLGLPPLSAGICAPCPSGCVAKWFSLCPGTSVVLSSLQCSSLSLVRVQCYLPGPC